jgi:uncharacterized protein (TIGR03067 family)
MTRTLLLLAAIFCAAAWHVPAAARDGGRPPESGEAAPAGDQLRGAWVLEAVEIMGKKIDGPGGMEQVLTFEAGGKVTMKDGMRNEAGTYKVNNSKRPREIDLTTPRGGNANTTETILGLYEIKGDRLRIAFSGNGPGGVRPKSMDGNDVAIVVLKRKK